MSNFNYVQSVELHINCQDEIFIICGDTLNKDSFDQMIKWITDLRLLGILQVQRKQIRTELVSIRDHARLKVKENNNE